MTDSLANHYEKDSRRFTIPAQRRLTNSCSSPVEQSYRTDAYFEGEGWSDTPMGSGYTSAAYVSSRPAALDPNDLQCVQEIKSEIIRLAKRHQVTISKYNIEILHQYLNNSSPPKEFPNGQNGSNRVELNGDGIHVTSQCFQDEDGIPVVLKAESVAAAFSGK